MLQSLQFLSLNFGSVDGAVGACFLKIVHTHEKVFPLPLPWTIGCFSKGVDIVLLLALFLVVNYWLDGPA